MQTESAGQQLAAPVPALEFEPALPSAAARTPRAWSEASLLAPPTQAAAPAGHRTHPAELHPQTPSGFWSPPRRQGLYPSLALRGYPVAWPRTLLRIVRFPESFSKDLVLRTSSPLLQILFRG